MSNKNGFTLVEMLAVIVLIAVLSVVAVSTYRGINESSKKKTLEAKIEQIESASEKWARENNITNRMTISVNNLVVEGYITADDVGTDGLAMIKNPVTNENMICNTIELSFKEGVIVSHFNSNDYNCKLANQSLEDSKINIKVISASNKKLSNNNSSSIAKWTNEDIIIIVDSTEYDNKATSISYDFEGSTTTKNKDSLSKYMGDTFISEAATNNYYNVYYIKSELLMNTKVVVTYDIPGEGTKSRAYTIRFDKEEAQATLKSESEWLTDTSTVKIIVDDGKGSGPAGIYLSQNSNSYEESSFKEANPSATLDKLEVGKYYIWTVDNAGNKSNTYKMILEINNIDRETPGCEILFHGTEGDHGWYISDVTPGAENTPPASISGVNVGISLTANTPTYSAFAAHENVSEAIGERTTEETPKEGIPYYCYAKSLAGLTSDNTRTLYIDKTPPTMNITVDNANTHERHKTVHVTIRDTLSGLNESATVEYGLSMSNTVEPTSWTNVEINTTAQNNAAVTKDFVTHEEVTGTWYLWIRAPQFKDYAGNTSKGNVSGTTYVFGPYKFDNTPPVCDGVGGKNNWMNGTYLVKQYCLDNDGTTDQSGCELWFFSRLYGLTEDVDTDTMVIRDNAGNETVCPTNVYQEHIKPTCEFETPVPDGENGWFKSSSVTLKASFQDNGPNNLQSLILTYGTALTPNSQNEQQTVTITDNGSTITAYCYVRDKAENENFNSVTIKKDDGSEAIAGGCSTILGNTTWTNIGPIHYGVKLNTIPISGCHESSTPWQGIWNSNCESIALTHAEDKTFTSTGYWVFATNSGVLINCPGRTHNIYLDKTDPECSISKSNTGTTSGVTIKMTCNDNLSGCNGKTWTNVKSSGSHTLKDAAGNSCSKSYTVTSYNCHCSNCHHTERVCQGGTEYGVWGSCSLTSDQSGPHMDCKVCRDTGSTIFYQCRQKSWNSCLTTTNACRYGCDTCYR